MRRKAIAFALGSLFTLVVVSLLVTPNTKITHESSSAFQVALNQAVDRLETGGRAVLSGTATPVVAAPMQPTYDGRYTCDTYEPAYPTCDPAAGCADHTTDPQSHTCMAEYTCDMATCDTYDPMQETCDPNDTRCTPAGGIHTFEPPPYNHTCEGSTCDGHFTCDFTVDPRAETCNAANPMCEKTTYNIIEYTCNPMLPECRINNPNHCTAQMYSTCDPSMPTCDVGDPLCTTVDPNDPNCATPVEKTTWGLIKQKFEE